MRRVYLVVLAFVVAAALILMIGFEVTRYRSADVTLEQPPCRSCARVYSSGGSIPTVGFCEFANNPARYANQMVRFKAIFINDANRGNRTSRQVRWGNTSRN